ncbi:hypothetical protein CDV31_013521 [Fusarium ambrosium]|uniref:SnoaL-like domain-containing protein n=1 Tax=Fusarium ambrosium TaxID=131363 RepID=A0A428T2S4_9HYPO|nr:hypothetical protein CDV31_013521 [Fusarium ambrosium]
MSYVMEGSIWPDNPVPTATKQLIARLLEIGDTDTPDSGEKMAQEIFTHDGVLDHCTYRFEGREAISKCRSGPKPPGNRITKSRHHISRVYSQTGKVDDLMLIGERVVEFEKGQTVNNMFAARAVVDESTPGTSPRLSLFTIYIASQALFICHISR